MPLIMAGIGRESSKYICRILHFPDHFELPLQGPGSPLNETGFQFSADGFFGSQAPHPRPSPQGWDSTSDKAKLQWTNIWRGVARGPIVQGKRRRVEINSTYLVCHSLSRTPPVITLNVFNLSYPLYCRG